VHLVRSAELLEFASFGLIVKLGKFLHLDVGGVERSEDYADCTIDEQTAHIVIDD
jgi:hypothetical protein